MAGFSMLPLAAASGASLAFFPPQFNTLEKTAHDVLEHALSTKSNLMFVVPAFLEELNRDDEALAKMKQFHVLMFGGDHFDADVGRRLAQDGYPLVPAFGTTEIGPASMMLPEEFGGEYWDYITLAPHIEPVFKPLKDDPNIFELCVLENPDHQPSVINSKLEGKCAYTTGDLVIRHPTNPRKFKVFGRESDQLVLSTGHKTNPRPIEAMFCQHPLIELAVMFGRGHPHNGILLQPVAGYEIEPQEIEALAKFRCDIWSFVEEINAVISPHSRISMEMVLLADPARAFELTAKRTPRRSSILSQYERDIREAYDAAGGR